MKVADVEYRDEYVTVAPADKAKAVASKILDGFPAIIASIVVKAGEPVGIVYLDTIIRSCVVGTKPAGKTKIEDIMDKSILKVTDQEDMELVKQKVAQFKPHGIIVIDAKGAIEGFISPRDWAIIIGAK
ncbi:MAG: CBS domain-containing protein [Candidatus Altiarchaeota archaeon]|nr:CBS domain-containing protein [Candidatus Altiarchaeota archaeon]